MEIHQNCRQHFANLFVHRFSLRVSVAFKKTIENPCYPESKYVRTIQTGKFNVGIVWVWKGHRSLRSPWNYINILLFQFELTGEG